MKRIATDVHPPHKIPAIWKIGLKIALYLTTYILKTLNFMRSIKRIHTLGAALLCAALAKFFTLPAVAKDTAGIRPTYNLVNQDWKHVPNEMKYRRGGNVGFSNPFKGRPISRNKMPSMPQVRMSKFPSPLEQGPKVIVDSDNRAYLGTTGPVNLQFSGQQDTEFDRNNIKYVELEGEFPRPPAKPRAVTTAVAPPPPPPTPPPVKDGVGESKAPILVTTKEPTLKERLERGASSPVGSTGSILFHKRVDQLSPSSDEIYTPFVIPYNAQPAAISVKGKATYIRE